MDHATCLEAVASLLSAPSHLLRSQLRDLDVNVDASADANHPPALPPSDGAWRAPSARPAAHIACRHSSRAGVEVDGLGVADPATAGAPAGPDPAHALAPASAGAFFTGDSVTILHDRVRSRADVETLLAHELTHARDFLVVGLDLGACGGLACSEVRAARAAECVDRWDFLGARRRCTREVASTSTRMAFGATDGPRCVAAVFDACYDGDVSQLKSSDVAGAVFAK